MLLCNGTCPRDCRSGALCLGRVIVCSFRDRALVNFIHRCPIFAGVGCGALDARCRSGGLKLSQQRWLHNVWSLAYPLPTHIQLREVWNYRLKHCIMQIINRILNLWVRVGAFLKWWLLSTMWAVLVMFYGRGCLNNLIFSHLGLCTVCWAHSMCHVLHHLTLSSWFPYTLFYRSLFSLSSSDWVGIAACGSISVHG